MNVNNVYDLILYTKNIKYKDTLLYLGWVDKLTFWIILYACVLVFDFQIVISI